MFDGCDCVLYVLKSDLIGLPAVLLKGGELSFVLPCIAQCWLAKA